MPRINLIAPPRSYSNWKSEISFGLFFKEKHQKRTLFLKGTFVYVHVYDLNNIQTINNVDFSSIDLRHKRYIDHLYKLTR